MAARLDEATARPRMAARPIHGPFLWRKMRAVGLSGRIKAVRSIC